jgi:hypothetical protein
MGVIGPMRLAYNELFSLLLDATNAISNCLTATLYKYKITYRTPDAQALEFLGNQKLLLKDETIG